MVVIRQIAGIALVLCTAALTAACGARRLDLPSGPGTPLPEYSAIHAEVSDVCRNVRTLTAVLSLSGRAGGERLRGDVHAGIRRPADMRLEGVTPFGGTVFLLVADSAGATLLLPREDRVVRDARAGEILGALTGVTFAPADLQAVLTGCVVPDPVATGGQSYTDGWIAIDLERDARVYLRRAGGRWRVRAAQRDGWQIEYPEWPDGALFPGRVELQSEMPVRVDLRANLSDVQSNVDLLDAAFTIEVPPDAVPLSIEELRESGPLREATASGSAAR